MPLTMQHTAKQFLRRVQLDQFVKMLVQLAQRGRRQLAGTDRALVRRYLDRHPQRKLQIGCGGNLRSGWLNSDYYPRSSGILHLDATQTFPLPSDAFDLVYSEHMIEHVPHRGGQAMLDECFRVLKPGGRIRISTPDLNFLVELLREDLSELQLDYIRWSTRRFIADAPVEAASYVVNNYVRDWGHTFIYDERTLRGSLERAGFTEVSRHALGESGCEGLRDLENLKRLPPGFLQLESMILEASKPGATFRA